ncbi:MAG: hypothetical protein ABIT96_03025 [Ferruginibacter sp.]
MKKFLMLLAICSFSFMLRAQTLEIIPNYINNQKWQEGKVAIDKILEDPKNQDKADAWYFKGRIYNAMSYDKALPLLDAYNYRAQAFEAFKKTQQLDTKDLRLKVEFYRPYLDLYFGYFDLGAAQFNNKDYMDAYNSFQRAQEVKDYILAKKYEYSDATLYPLDTSLVLNSAIAAGLAKDKDLSMKSYRVLADANVSGKNYMDVYEALSEYYYKKEDNTNLDLILTKARGFYPENDYWTDIELDRIRKSGDKQMLLKKYKELLATSPDNFLLNYNYSVELFNNLYGKDAQTTNLVETKQELTNLLKKAIAVDKGIDATVLMANHQYNMASDISGDVSRLKGTSPEAVKKKADLNTQYMVKMNDFITYAELASKYYDAKTDMTPIQKGVYKSLLINLEEVYNVKKDSKKAAEVRDKKNKLN